MVGRVHDHEEHREEIDPGLAHSKVRLFFLRGAARRGAVRVRVRVRVRTDVVWTIGAKQIHIMALVTVLRQKIPSMCQRLFFLGLDLGSLH